MRDLERWGVSVAAAVVLSLAGGRGVSAAVFPNDAGKEEVDVSAYPESVRKGYNLMLKKCSACHKVSRPINSQFVEMSDEEIQKAQADQPSIFKNKLVWEIVPKKWSMMVHRMMVKPGSQIKPDEGKLIYEFLVYDAKIRKTGANAAVWKEQRERLVADFAKENPDAYKALFGDAPPAGGK